MTTEIEETVIDLVKSIPTVSDSFDQRPAFKSQMTTIDYPITRNLTQKEQKISRYSLSLLPNQKVRLSQDSMSKYSQNPELINKTKDESFIKKTNISFYKNYPSFSMAKNQVSYKQVISKEHIQDVIGKETPGVGHYSPKN